MTLEKVFFFVIIIGIGFTAELVTIGHKKYSQKEMQHLSVKYLGISWKYWGGILLIAPLIFFTLQQGLNIAQKTPEYGSRIGYFSFVLSIAYISLYQSVFAFLTNAYPVGKWDFVISEGNQAKLLALRGVLLVILLLSIALAFALHPFIVG